MLKPLVTKFRSDLSVRLSDIAKKKKTGPREPETDSSWRRKPERGRPRVAPGIG